MPLRTKIYVALTIVAASAAIYWGSHYAEGSWLLFLLFLVAVLLSSGLKVALPRGDGGMSLNFPFILLAVVQLSPLQAMLLAAISIAAQCRFKVKNTFTLVQIVFNVASSMWATAAAAATYMALTHVRMALAPALAIAAVAYFVVSTGTVALVIASASKEPPFALWKKEFPWYLPFYFVGARARGHDGPVYGQLRLGNGAAADPAGVHHLSRLQRADVAAAGARAAPGRDPSAASPDHRRALDGHRGQGPEHA